jgi:hypothetical protein
MLPKNECARPKRISLPLSILKSKPCIVRWICGISGCANRELRRVVVGAKVAVPELAHPRHNSPVFIQASVDLGGDEFEGGEGLAQLVHAFGSLRIGSLRLYPFHAMYIAG